MRQGEHLNPIRHSFQHVSGISRAIRLKLLWKFRSKRRAIQLKQVKYKPLFSIGDVRARASVELLFRYWRFPAAGITNG